MDWPRCAAPLAMSLTLPLLACGDDGPAPPQDGSSTGDASTSAGPTSGPGTTGPDDSSDDGVDSGSSTGLPPVDCSDFMGLATPEQTAMTPRADAEAEQLAIEASTQIVAPQEIYERVVTDLELIRTNDPTLAAIEARPDYALSSLLVALDAEGTAALEDGTYQGWDCINELYGVTEVEEYFGELYRLHFDGRYFIPALGADYQMVENLFYTEPDLRGLDGPDVCLSVLGPLHLYIFDDARGDCPSGCTESLYTGYTVDGMGTVTLLGTYQVLDDGMPPPPPAWFSSADDCTQWL